MTESISSRLNDLGLTLPPAPAPVATYTPTLMSGNLLFISGQISKPANADIITGTLGANLTLDDGIEAARVCALNILAQANAALGNLDLIEHVARLNGFVCATPDFTDHPKVINGASDLMVKILGDAGKHTRAAIGVASLPAGCAVEIDAILVIKPT